jgi:hypothetical protein
MTRINTLRNIKGSHAFAWGKNIQSIRTNLRGDINALVFAVVLIACSLGVGCSSQKAKPVSSNNEIPATQAQTTMAPAPTSAVQAENKPVPKKVVHRKPATVNYTDKTYGVNFEYPRRYAIETGDAAADLLTSSPVPMNFVAPGGVALAAVELPETGFANTDFSSAFFDVTVNKNLTADQCKEFAVPQPKVIESTASSDTASSQATEQTASTATAPAQSGSPSPESAATASPTATSTSIASESKMDDKAGTPEQSEPEAQGSKLMLGNLELRATEAVSGEGTRQSDAKYFHVFQNGACYEFALNLTTVASEDGLIKHVNRDRVFDRLEKILATVKIEDVETSPAPEGKAETPTASTTPVADTPVAPQAQAASTADGPAK